MATLFSFVVALLFLFYPNESVTPQFLQGVSILMATVGALFLLLIPLLNVLLYRPLQKVSQHYTPVALELFRRDRLYQITNLLIVSFSIISFAVAIDPGIIRIQETTILVPLWVIVLGLVIDCTWLMLRRALRYLSPFLLAEQCLQSGNHGIQEKQNPLLWESMNSLTEIASAGIERHTLSLPSQALDHLQLLWSNFLHSCKSISHALSKENGNGGDEVSFTLFFLLQRFEWLSEQAFREKNEAVLGEMITDLAKVVVSCARFDLSLTTYPIHTLGKIAQKGAKEKLADPPVKATCSLGEVAKNILEEVDLTYAELQPTFFSLIGNLEAIAKEAFRQDKKTPIPLLRQVFVDLEELFQQEKVKEHQDAEPIRADLSRVINDFNTLETVMNTMPPLAELGEEEKKG